MRPILESGFLLPANATLEPHLYQALLTRKYLFSRIMPLLAVFAVMLATVNVLVAWSVMGGFLNMLLSSGRSMVGDVSITWPNSGFAYYEDLVKRLEAEKDAVEAACPVVETYGLVSLADDRVEPVQIKGVDVPSYSRVVDFPHALWWKPITTPEFRDKEGRDLRLDKDPRIVSVLSRLEREGLAMAEMNPETGKVEDAAVAGIEMIGLSSRTAEGYYVSRGLLKTTPTGPSSANMFAFDSRINLRLVPMDSKGRSVELVSWNLPVANEYRTGVYEVDRRTVLVPLKGLQRRMKMDESLAVTGPVDPYGPPPATAAVDPARVNTVLVRGVNGISPDELRKRVLAVYKKFAADYAGKVPMYETMENEAIQLIKTWEMSQAQFIGQVKRETAVVVLLLSLMWLVSAMLIMTIFWAMISEKTKDIGILRSLGASRWGVAWLWVRYGLAIGIVGVILGFGAAYLLVHNINPIHEWLGDKLGIVVWDPKMYYFAEIPNKVDPARAALVMFSGVFFSFVGALIPALRAALMRPVTALRFE